MPLTLRSAALCALLALTTTVASAQSIARTGGEFTVNPTVAADQLATDVAVGADGSFVAVWDSAGQDSSLFAVVGQRYSSDRQPIGDEFIVNTEEDDLQILPRITIGPNGEFIVVWMSIDQDGFGSGIFFQRYDAAGTPQGAETQANTTGFGDQEYPDVAIADDGSFLVVWESDGQDGSFGGIYARLFAADGTPSADEFRVNSTTADDQNDPAVVALTDGFVVAWESTGQDAGGEGVFLQRLDATGALVGGELQANISETGDQEDVAVAVGGDGTIVVVWESDGQDGSSDAVVARAFDADLLPIGGENLLNTTVAGGQRNPEVAPVGADGFVVAWEGPISGPLTDTVWARRIGLDAAPTSAELQVQTTDAITDEQQIGGNVASDVFVVSWRTEGNTNADIAGQRYELAFFANGFETGDTTAWSASVP